jgi:PAS domain S-box-containing protein
MSQTAEEKEPLVNILMVDDHPANLLALEGILEPLGQRLVKATSGEEALKWLLKETFAVILMDVQMPGMDGFETVELIKRHERTRFIPVIFLTALSRDASHVFQGYAKGAVDYLMKPFDPEILRSKVSVFVDLFRKTDQVKRQQAQLAQQEREAIERKSEQRFRALIESMPACVWAADATGKLTYANRVWLEYSGLPQDQLHRSFELTLHPDDAPLANQAWQSSVQTGRPLALQLRLRNRTGEYRWHLTRAVPEYDEAGLCGWIVTATDIHDQKRNEEALAQFKTSLDATQDSVAMFTQDELRLRYVNDGALKQLGYAREELLGQTVLRIEAGLEEAAFRRSLGPLMDGREASRVYETLHRRKDGSEFPVEVILQYIPAGPGGTGHFVCIARDITERKQTEESLRLAIEAKDDFIAAASHELRTPLQAAKGYLHLATMKLGGSANADTGTGRALSVIARQVDRMAKLVEELLDISRIQAGRLSLELEEFDLVSLLRDLHERMRVLSEQHELQLHVPEHLPIFGDRGRLDQVITNLISNAIRYSPTGGSVTVSATRVGGSVQVSVKDHGLGIPKEKQAMIFERFGRAHGSRYGGLGLGLSICQGIIEQHGGRIWVESDGLENHGSTFHIRLPLRACDKVERSRAALGQEVTVESPVRQ